MPEAIILAWTNPKYDNRLLIELQAQYMKITSSEHVAYIHCSEFPNKTNKQKTIYVHNSSCELVIFMYWTCNSMNNLLSYCGLVDRASDKDSPVFWSGPNNFGQV